MLTVYGIETLKDAVTLGMCIITLQQCLPFTVLKLLVYALIIYIYSVATVLTVYGIETDFTMETGQVLELVCCNSAYRLRY